MTRAAARPRTTIVAMIVALITACSPANEAHPPSTPPPATSAPVNTASSSDAKAPAFRVDPDEALMDEPVGIRVTGLPADKRVTITARATDVDSTTWTSSAQFITSADGVVSLTQQSVGGSYLGRNAMACSR